MIGWRTLFLTAVLFLIYLFRSPITRLIERYKKRKRQRLFSNEPSQALIDQLLPLEVLIDIIGSHDVEFLRKCRQVSKYWNFVAASIPPQHYLKQLRLSRPTIEKLKRDIPTHALPKTLSVNWLDYPPDWYDLQFLCDDADLVRRKRRKIIDAEIADLFRITKLFKGNSDNFYSDLVLHYLAKVRGRLFKKHGDYYIEGPETDENIFFPIQPEVADSDTVEIITELALLIKRSTDYCRITQPYIYAIRALTKPPPKGIIPTGKALVEVLFYLYTPCIASDLIHPLEAAAPHIYDILRASATVSCSGLVLLLQAVNEGGQSCNFSYAIASTILNTAVAALALLTGPIWEFTTFVTYIGAVGVFDDLIDRNKQQMQKNYGYTELIRRIWIGIFMLTVDWSAAIRSMIDGSIWSYLLRNIAYSTYSALYVIVWQLLRFNWKWTTVNTPKMKYLLSRIYILGLFYTLYAPAFKM